MATCDADTLLASASCYACLPKGQQELIKLALLAQILLALNPSADTTPQTLLANAQCFSCFASSKGTMKLLELQLLCEINAVS